MDKLLLVDGLKTAAALLQQFESLEGIMANVDAIGKPSVRIGLAANIHRLQINHQLIKLDGGAPLPLPINRLAYTDCGLSTKAILQAIGLQ